MTFRRIQPASDAGDTFVELLIAITIMAIAVGSILGGLMAALSSSTEHRSLANVDAVLRSFAEAAQSDIELQPNPWYQDCAAVSSSGVSPATYAGNQITFPPSAPTPPAGWSSPYIVSLQFVHETWNQNTQTLTPSGPDSSCTAPACREDSQLLTVGLTGPDGSSDRLTVGLRNPQYNSTAPC